MHVLHAATPALEGLLAITLGTWGFELPTYLAATAPNNSDWML